MDTRRLEVGFFVALLALALYVSWLIFAPYVSALVLAGTLAFLFRSVYKYLLRLFRYPSVAALGTMILVIVIVFLPLGYFGARISGEATTLYSSLTSSGRFDFGAALNSFLQTNFSGVQLPAVTVDFNAFMSQGLKWLLQNLVPLFSGVAQVFFGAFLSLIGLFYFLRDGESLGKWVLGLVPLERQYATRIMHEMGTVASSVVRGTLVIALIQGIVAGASFAVFNVPNPTFWGSLVMLSSLIPFVGPWLVVVPAIAYLFFIGETATGIGLVIWSVVAINLIGTMLVPLLMRRGSHMHPFVILLSVLGGIGLFGPIGFLIGPFVMVFLFSLLKIYPDLILKRE